MFFQIKVFPFRLKINLVGKNNKNNLFIEKMGINVIKQFNFLKKYSYNIFFIHKF